MHPDVKQKINKVIKSKTAKKPNFMRLVKENEDKDRRKENNRIVREMTADGRETTRKHRTKADDDNTYAAEPNPDRTMGKIWLEVDKWVAEHMPDGLPNIYIPEYECLAAPKTCTPEVRAALLEACKCANSKNYPYDERVNMSTALKPTEATMEVAHKFYDQFKFEDLLDVALNEQKADNAFAAILLLHRDEFEEYCLTPSAQVRLPGDYWTRDGENGAKARRKAGSVKKNSSKEHKAKVKKINGTKEHTAKAREVSIKVREIPILLIKEDGEVVGEYESTVKCSTELEIKQPLISRYLKDGKFHKVKSLGCKCKFIKAE